jgi:hypothetical protein
MIYFHNPGLIDLEAVRTMGASVKLPNSFGIFGTGFKYGLATVLRGGGAVTLWRGDDRHEFHTEERQIRGETFEIVCMDGASLGFTTQLGRNWQPWMAFREFACNARDEGGDFASSEEGRGLDAFQGEESTVIVIEWGDLDDAWRQRGDLFLEGEPIYQNEQVRILPGPSPHLFYRGVRVFKLEKPAAYSYDILTEQMLTEDRTLYGEWSASAIIRDALLEMDSKAALEKALCAGSNYYEGAFNYEQAAKYKTPTRAFLDTVMEARERGDSNLNGSAKIVLQKHMRKTADSEAYGGGFYHRAINDAFSYAIEALDELGVKFSEKQPFITTDELPEGVMSMVESGRVYVHNDLLRRNAREIAGELLKRWVDLAGLYTPEAVVDTLGPLLIGRHDGMRRILKAIEEDAKVEEIEAVEG